MDVTMRGSRRRAAPAPPAASSPHSQIPACSPGPPAASRQRHGTGRPPPLALLAAAVRRHSKHRRASVMAAHWCPRPRRPAHASLYQCNRTARVRHWLPPPCWRCLHAVGPRRARAPAAALVAVPRAPPPPRGASVPDACRTPVESAPVPAPAARPPAARWTLRPLQSSAA